MKGTGLSSPARICLAGAMALTIGSSLTLGRQASRPPEPAAVSSSTTTAMMSPVAVASWITERHGNGPEHLQLLVLWRGRPGWFLGDGGSGSSGSESAGRYHETITYAGLQFILAFDSSKRIATVNGKDLKLAEDNVVFVDDLDSPDALHVVVGTMSLPRVMPGSAAQIGLVLRKSPEIMTFLRCDAEPPDGAGRAMLERLCLQTIGR